MRHNSKACTLVLLPGLDGTGTLFAPLLAELPKNIRSLVIAYPNRPMTLKELADFVLAALPEGQFTLLAESFSGLVALTLLNQIRERVQSVVFCAAFAEPPRPWLIKLSAFLPLMDDSIRHAPSFLLRRFCLGPDATASQIALVRRALSLTDASVLSHRLSLIRQMPQLPTVNFDVACHYLQAAEDKLVPEHCADWFRKRFNRFALHRIAGGHFLLQAKAQECAQALTGIIEQT